jgi:hypothetical protein
MDMKIWSLFFALMVTSVPPYEVHAQDQTFGGFTCTVDCSGHAAGYRWAEEKGIQDESDCPQGNSQSFHEGCVAYTQDGARDPNEDDDGNAVGGSSIRPMDSNDDDDNDDDDK